MKPPDKLFIFVSQTALMSRYNFELVGRIDSAAASAWDDPTVMALYRQGRLEYGVKLNNPKVLSRMSPFMTNYNNDPLEIELEAVRFATFSHLPSRLSALYGFAEREECERASELYGWDMTEMRTVRVLQDERVRAHRANMNLITILRGFPIFAGPAGHPVREGITHYWQGSGNPPEGVIVSDTRLRESLCEWLVEGTFFRTDEPRATLAEIVAEAQKEWGWVPPTLQRALQAERQGSA